MLRGHLGRNTDLEFVKCIEEFAVYRVYLSAFLNVADVLVFLHTAYYNL